MAIKYTKSLRSMESSEPVQLVMINTTQRLVDVLWINYTSQLVRYKILKSHWAFRMTSFKTHPWIFRDFETGILMHVDYDKEVLLPEPPPKDRPHQRVYIHFPMQSLKTISLWSIATQLRSFAEIDELEIPQTLNSDLKTIARKLHEHRSMITRSIQLHGTNR